jgi:hypothetical protein
MNNDAYWAKFKAKEAAFDTMIKPATEKAQFQIARATEVAKVWGSHFGATGIDPKHLFIYFVLPTRKDVANFRQTINWVEIKSSLMRDLETNGFPVEVLQDDWVEIFSEQQCKEEANGNWYHFFK